jgi:uncharacterized protein with NRDE domain
MGLVSLDLLRRSFGCEATCVIFGGFGCRCYHRLLGSYLSMCILFLVVGDHSHPTLVCNNRDEYIDRPTSRGSLTVRQHPNNEDVQDLLYSPVDKDCGGSWLSFSQLNHDRRGPRCAIVLNFHMFREDSTLSSRQYDPSLRSRGVLVKDFVESDLSASDYAQEVFRNRDQYRTFNLVVVDGHNSAFYVSSSLQQRTPIQLNSGVLYGITNGFIFDDWTKVSLGKQLLERVFNDHMSESMVRDWSVGPLVAMDHSGEVDQYVAAIPVPLSPLIDELLSVLRNDTLLPDPTYADSSEAIMQLSSILVKPTWISRTRPTTSSQLSHLQQFRTLESVLAHNSEVSVENLSKNLFATRTNTLFLHWSTDFLRRHQNCASNVDTGLFFILESDRSLEWRDRQPELTDNIHVFHNINS